MKAYLFTTIFSKKITSRRIFKQNFVTYPLRSAAIIFSAVFFLNACSIADQQSTALDTPLNNTPDKNDKSTLESLVTQSQKLLSLITTNIGSAVCENNKQCGALAIGHKACGGPSDYLTYSTSNTDTTLLLEQSEQQRSIAKEINQLNNATSDCAFISPPPVSCINNQCKKGGLI